MAAEPNLVVVECGGVGFKCMTTLGTQRQLPAVGSEVQLFTHLNVREDAMDLFGFYTKTELNCFRMLTAVSGVGPKVGLAILSELTPEQVAMAVACGDSKSLSRASGVGPKLAQRIALELKDKVGGSSMELDFSAGVPAAVPQGSGNLALATAALQELGYSPSEINAALKGVDPAASTEEMVRHALRAMVMKG